MQAILTSATRPHTFETEAWLAWDWAEHLITQSHYQPYRVEVDQERCESEQEVNRRKASMRLGKKKPIGIFRGPCHAVRRNHIIN